MNIVELRITRTIGTSRYGGLSDGDILRTDPAYARHLVEELRVAQYRETIAAPADKPRRPRKPKTKEQP